MQGGGGRRGGEGDNHNNGSYVPSLNDNNSRVEEKEAVVDTVKDEGEDFATGSTLIRGDNTVTMMYAPPPLLKHRSLPLRGMLLQRDDRAAGMKNAAASATTAAKVVNTVNHQC